MLDDLLLEEIKKRYGFAKISKPQRLNYREDRALWKIKILDKPLVIRTFSEKHCEVNIRKDLDLLKFLQGHSFPAPRLLKTLGNKDYFSWENLKIAVSTYIEGIPASTLNQHKDSIFGVLGTNLALLHLLGELTNFYPYGHVSRRAPVKIIPFYLTKLNRVIFSKKYFGWQEELLLLQRRWEELPAFSKLPHTIIHSDVCEGNLILTDEGKGVLIDWYDSGWGPAIIDVGYILAQRCLWPGVAGVKLNSELARSFLVSYLQRRLLTKEEIDFLPEAMKFANLLQTTIEVLDKAEGLESREEFLELSENWKRFNFLSFTTNLEFILQT